MLDTWTWKNEILPKMALRYGISKVKGLKEMEMESSSEIGKKIVDEANIFPDEPLMKVSDWNKIEKYYLSRSKESFMLPKRSEIQVSEEQFKSLKPKLLAGVGGTVLARFDPKGELMVTDAKTRDVRVFDQNLNLKRSISAGVAIAHRERIGNTTYYLSMGQVFPTNDPKGKLFRQKDGQQVEALIDSLQRPVSAVYDDFDRDGDLDVVVSEFGFHVGQLSLFLNDGNDRFEKKKLFSQAGSMQSELRDMNNDGIKDVVVLSAQGNEGITVYLNDGKANFEVKKILSFPPMYGSSFFEFVDLNGDSLDDIIYTCGDNADYEPILKPYHGIYAFLNKGNMEFKRLFFEYLNGAYGAKVADFDLDGDLDIAANSFFPDYKDNPQESFVFMRNQGNWNFERSTIPEYVDGRWLTMDMADWDEDGDQDLVLTHMFFAAESDPDEYKKDWQLKAPAFMVLMNQTN